MKQNIIEIPIPETPDTEPSASEAGSMYEHNATALCFILPQTLRTDEYRCYVEFVTAAGTARTEYLSPDENGKILVPLPLEITAQMTALSVFNAVKISGAGKTEQRIIAKTVRLYFSALENTEKLLDAEYAFSVNTLLEAIRQNTFKGEKGDKGDAYILTDADKTEIAARMNQAFYGLPMQKRMTVRGKRQLSGATDSAAVSALTVQPAEAVPDGIRSVQIAIGKNLLSDILDSSLYSKFSAVEGNYAAIPIHVKPDAPYVLARLSDDLAQYSHSYLKTDEKTYWFCHKSNQNLSSKYTVFTAPANGQCTLYTTYIYLSQNAYQQVIDTDWEGLTLMEQDNSVLLQKNFSEPLYAVSAQIADSFDFISGTLTRRTAKAALTPAQLVSDAAVQLTDTAYRYKLILPENSPARICGCTAGICGTLPTLLSEISDGAAYAAYRQERGESEGIWFGSYDDGLYIVSEKAPDAFTQWLGTQPLEILYASAERTESDGTAALSLPTGDKEICVSPNSLCAEVRFSADISAVANDLESRIAKLENNI